MSINESIWDVATRWNGQERRFGDRQQCDDWQSRPIVTIYTADDNEIIGLEADHTESGIGVAISNSEPIEVHDEVRVERLGHVRRGKVRHITTGAVVVVGINWARDETI